MNENLHGLLRLYGVVFVLVVIGLACVAYLSISKTAGLGSAVVGVGSSIMAAGLALWMKGKKL